jgi:hypothetical protein
MSRGEGSIPIRGEGSIPIKGKGSIPIKGKGSIPIKGEGSIPIRGEGSIPIRGEGSIPITKWDAEQAAEGTAAAPEPFDDGGFEEYWEKMELLDLDETDIPLDQLECGSDRDDFGSSMHSYLNDLSPMRSPRTGGGGGEGGTGNEGQDYAALLEQVSEHLAGTAPYEEGEEDQYQDDDEEAEEEEEEDDGAADYEDDYEEDQQQADTVEDEDDDGLFDDYETDHAIARALSRGVADTVRVEASQEAYSSDGEQGVEDEAPSLGRGEEEEGEGYQGEEGEGEEEEGGDYADDYEQDDDDEGDDDEGIEYGAPQGKPAGSTGLFSPSHMKRLLDQDQDYGEEDQEQDYGDGYGGGGGGDGDGNGNDDDDNDYNDYVQEQGGKKRSSHSQSRTVDRSKFSAGSYADQQPDSRGAEVIFSANSFGDDGAAPVFTYKDFEFLPAAEEEEDGEGEHKPQEKRRRPPQGQGHGHGQGGGKPLAAGQRRKKPLDHGPAPPRSKRAGPYNQEKLGPMPGVQHMKKGKGKKGKTIDPEQARKNRENRDRHKMMLSMIALKRKEQEDEAVRLVMKEEAKRRRFKEALLEKALRSRRAEEGGEEEESEHAPSQPSSDRKAPRAHAPAPAAAAAARDGSAGGHRAMTRAEAGHSPEDPPPPAHIRGSLMEPTKAFEAQRMPPRKRQEEAEDEDEKAQKEEEKYEQVAQMRRKFKEQHKQILLNMLVKKREADKKKEEEEKVEAHRALVKKARRDERLAQKALGAAAAAAEAAMAGLRGEEAPPPAVTAKAVTAKKPKRRPELPPEAEAGAEAGAGANAFVTATIAPDDHGIGQFGEVVASTGNKIPLVRSRSQRESREDLATGAGTEQGGGSKPPRRRRAADIGSGAEDSPGRRSKSAAVGKASKEAAIAAAAGAGAGAGGGGGAVGADGKPRMRRERSRTDIESPANRSPEGQCVESNAHLRRNLAALDEELDKGLGALGEGSGVGKQRRVAAAAAREKIDAQMRAVADLRAQKAEEERKEGERIRRRVEKLAKRIVQEGGMAAGRGEEGEEEPASEPKATRPKKVTPEMTEAMVARLQAKVQRTAEGIAQMSNASPPARDFVDWKRKHNVPSGAQVFSMTGWYPCVKEALIGRGWVFNPDPLSPFFDLKWTLRSSDIGLESLQPWQLTNHFLKNIALTTKVGLLKSLRQLVWQADISPDDIIPRGYDLTNGSELHAFVADFRLQKAEGMLKGLYARLIGSNKPLMRPPGTAPSACRPTTAPKSSEEEGSDKDEATIAATAAAVTAYAIAQAIGKECEDSDGSDYSEGKEGEGGQGDLAPERDGSADGPRPFTARVLYDTPVPLPTCSGSDPSATMVNKAVFEACCSALERSLRPEDDTHIDSSEEEDGEIPMTPLEWELLTGHDLYAPSTGGLVDTPPEFLGAFGLDVTMDEDSAAHDPLKAQKYQAALHRNKRKQRKIDTYYRAQAAVAVTELMAVGDEGLRRVHTLLYRLQALCVNQDALNGSGEISKNIWIVKPAAKSRGRGITTFTDLDKLLLYCDTGSTSNTGGGGASMWIAQKYMENPMTIANRKFDMRQWVLVTDWNPLTIYFFDEAYCRFSSEEYTTDDSSLDNAFVHLVNQSVNKHNQKKNQVVVAENGESIDGFMWNTAQFKKYLIHKSGGTDIWTEKMQPRMKDIAKMTLGCAVDMIEHRKNSWELYGFDFMVDDEFNAWLIEVNSSPACDYSTPTTERYVQKALVELLSVSLDVRAWEQAPRKERGEKPDTGGWECIYKGPLLETPAASFGTDMSVKGAAVKLPRRAAPPGGGGQIGTLSMGGTSNSFGDTSGNGSATGSATSGGGGGGFTSTKGQQGQTGPVGGKLSSSVRRQAGAEHVGGAAPRGGRREVSGGGGGGGENDDDSDSGDGYAPKPGAKNKNTSAVYNPSSIAVSGSGSSSGLGSGLYGGNSNSGSGKGPHPAGAGAGAGGSPPDAAFDDSDEEEAIRKSGSFAGTGAGVGTGAGAGIGGKNGNNASRGSSKKIVDTPSNSIAVKPKLFAVDF